MGSTDQWKSRLEKHTPKALFDPIKGDGFFQQGKVVYNPVSDRIEIFPSDGGWFGLYPDGHWEFDIAPYHAS